ncbi:MAG: hypothetical protein KC414_12685, partial [Romboutsia sp.]|nr:hypothetical protein [Romboutsia sp.]
IYLLISNYLKTNKINDLNSQNKELQRMYNSIRNSYEKLSHAHNAYNDNCNVLFNKFIDFFKSASVVNNYQQLLKLSDIQTYHFAKSIVNTLNNLGYTGKVINYMYKISSAPEHNDNPESKPAFK